MSTNSLILLACVTMAGTTISKHTLDKQHPKVRWVQVSLAALLVGVFLSFIASAAEPVARNLAWLLIVSSLLINGKPLLTTIGNIGK